MGVAPTGGLYSAICQQRPSPPVALVLIVAGKLVADGLDGLQPLERGGVLSELGCLISPFERSGYGTVVPRLNSADRAAAGCACCWSRPRPAFADERAACSASVLPNRPPGVRRCRATCSALWQRGHASPTAHNSIAGTTDLQTGQRTCARSTISPLQPLADEQAAVPSIAVQNTPDDSRVKL
jgi:hypothetical protein